MLEDLELQRIARDIVSKRLPTVELDGLVTQRMTNSDGEEALRITLVLTPGSVDAISGDDALKLLVDIRDGLSRVGEERLPIIEYATSDDVPGEDD